MATDDTGFDDLDESLIQKEDFCAPGTFWVIREPVHGEAVNGIISMDSEGNKDFSVCGEVYCANCEKWSDHTNTQKAKSCPHCFAPFKAKDWFPEKDYCVEVNGVCLPEIKPFQEAVDFAQTKRGVDKVVIVSAVYSKPS